MSYNLGGGYSRTGDYIPNGEQSAQSNYSVYGGMRFARGIATVDVSGRYLVHNVPNVFNPALVQSGASFAAPFYTPAQNQSQSVGARIGLALTNGGPLPSPLVSTGLRWTSHSRGHA